MAEPRTKKTDASVKDFLDRVADEQRRTDCRALVRMMKKATGASPKMWGPNIVGFGSYRYVGASGRTGDWPIIAFSPRKQALTLYIMPGFEGQGALMKKLGPHKTGKSCLYLKRLADVDGVVLEKLVHGSVAHMKRKYE
jgi:Domain of unknown function (DU1801)